MSPSTPSSHNDADLWRHSTDAAQDGSLATAFVSREQFEQLECAHRRAEEQLAAQRALQQVAQSLRACLESRT